MNEGAGGEGDERPQDDGIRGRLTIGRDAASAEKARPALLMLPVRKAGIILSRRVVRRKIGKGFGG
jgi:hypothetical protein